MALKSKKLLPMNTKGQAAGLIGAIFVIAISITVLFVTLFMNAKVANVSDLANDVNFSGTFDNLVTSTGDVYDVTTIALIITALALGLAALVGVAALFGVGVGGGGRAGGFAA